MVLEQGELAGMLQTSLRISIHNLAMVMMMMLVARVGITRVGITRVGITRVGFGRVGMNYRLADGGRYVAAIVMMPFDNERSTSVISPNFSGSSRCRLLCDSIHRVFNCWNRSTCGES